MQSKRQNLICNDVQNSKHTPNSRNKTKQILSVIMATYLLALMLTGVTCPPRPPTPTIVGDDLSVKDIDPCIKRVQVTMTQGNTTQRFEVQPVGGQARRRLNQNFNFAQPVTIQVEILETDIECLVASGASFIFNGTLTNEGQQDGIDVWSVSLNNFTPQVTIVVNTTGADAEGQRWLEIVTRRLRELADILGIDLTGKTIQISFGPVDGGDAETRGVPGDPNTVTMKISAAICRLPGANDLDIVLAHELEHMRNLISPAGQRRTQLRQDAIDADAAAAAAAQAGAPNRIELKKAALRAEIEYLEELRDEEERAYNSARTHRDALGLTDEDLRRNEQWRDDALRGLDERIQDDRRLLRTLRC